MTKETLKNMFGGIDPEETLKQTREEGNMILISILSDVQEMIERGMNERARININHVKYVLSNWHLSETPLSLDEVSELARDQWEEEKGK